MEKFDTRLQKEITRLLTRNRGVFTLTASDPIPVIITHPERTVFKKVTDRKGLTKDAERSVTKKMEPIIRNLKTFDIAPLSNMGPLRPIERPFRNLKTFDIDPLSNSIRTSLTLSQLNQIKNLEEVQKVRLSIKDKVTCLDDSVDLMDVRSEVWDMGFAGKGVKVAVLDTGVDLQHPHLRVKESVSCVPGVSDKEAGDHGTHCAGIIASQDSLYKGVAPECELINVKVMTSEGFAEPTYITKGIARAIELGADVISMSLGWNQIPSPYGHGWNCEDGDCPLCRAVDAAAEMGVAVIVASGNEHDTAESLKERNIPFPTELGCPGQARGAITVGAVDKVKNLAYFSSQGPTSYHASKPDLCSYGVNITSTVPEVLGIFSRMSGTSMSTPHVAGLVALCIQKYRTKNNNNDPSPRLLRNLLRQSCESIGLSPNEQGAGVVNGLSAVNNT